MDEITLVSQLLGETEPTPQTVSRGRQRLTEFSARPRPRYRHGYGARSRRVYPVAAGMTAAAAAVAVAVTLPLASGGTPERQVRTSAAESRATLTAITTALGSAAGDILHARTGDWTAAGQQRRWEGWVWPWNPRAGQRVLTHVSYVNDPDTEQRYQTLTAQAPPPGSWAAKSGSGIYGQVRDSVSVDYSGRTWQRATFTAGKGTPVPWTQTVAAIRAEIASGGWLVVGPGEIGGHKAIELRWKNGLGPLYGPDSGTWELWVDAKTYLPVAEILNETGARKQYAVTTYQFLPPTPANLETFRVVVPPGFTKLAPSHPASSLVPRHPASSLVPRHPASSLVPRHPAGVRHVC